MEGRLGRRGSALNESRAARSCIGLEGELFSLYSLSWTTCNDIYFSSGLRESEIENENDGRGERAERKVASSRMHSDESDSRTSVHK